MVDDHAVSPKEALLSRLVPRYKEFSLETREDLLYELQIALSALGDQRCNIIVRSYGLDGSESQSPEQIEAQERIPRDRVRETEQNFRERFRRRTRFLLLAK